jgi:hypothetical protein
MGAAVAEGDQSRRDGAGAAALTSPPPVVPPYPPSADGSPAESSPAMVPAEPAVSPPVVPPPPVSTPTASGPRADAGPEPFTVERLLLLDSVGTDPVDIDSLTFADDGIGVVRSRGESARVLPWSSVATQMVEAWGGGIIPEWWVDPELNRGEAAEGARSPVLDPGATNRALPQAEAGALICIKASFGTYRFLLPGGDARELSRRVTAFAVRNQGPTGESSVTRVVAWGLDAERRKVARRPKRTASWSRVQPILVVALIVFLFAAATLILLQSAGTIHLPFLGGPAPGTLVPTLR